MGTPLAQPIFNIAKSAAQDTRTKVMAETARYLTESGESYLSRFESGRWFLENFKLWERESKADTIKITQPFLRSEAPTLPPPVRKANAEFNLDLYNKSLAGSQRRNATLYFGSNKEHLAQVANNIRNESKSNITAQLSGDIMSTLLKEQGTGDITRGQAVKMFVSGLKYNQFIKAADLEGWRTKAQLDNANSPYIKGGEFERAVKNFSSYIYLWKIVLPHLGQPIYTLLNEGVTAFARSMWQTSSDWQNSFDAVVRTGAMLDETIRATQEIAEGKPTSLLRFIHMPLFSIVRPIQMVQSGIAAKAHAIDMAMELARNPGNKFAAIEMKRFGLNPNNIIRQGGKLTQDDIDNAIYQGIDTNFFITRKGLYTPSAWEATPLSRIMTMYKHFTYRAGKMLKDSLYDAWKTDKTEFAKRVGILATVFPATGLMIQELYDFAGLNFHNMAHPFSREKAWHPTKTFGGEGNETIDTLINAYSHVGALGMVYSMYRAAGFGGTSDWIAGPAFGLLSDTLKSLINLGQGKFTPIIKRLGYKIPIAGSAIGSHVEDIEDWVRNNLM